MLFVESICFNCLNAVPNAKKGYGCSWSRTFTPVDGWEAKASGKTSRGISYRVTSCPEYKEDFSNYVIEECPPSLYAVALKRFASGKQEIAERRSCANLVKFATVREQANNISGSYRCIVCQKELDGKQKKFCSDLCANELYNAKKRLRSFTPHNVVCPVCGKAYVKQWKHHTACSVRCMGLYIADYRKKPRYRKYRH